MTSDCDADPHRRPGLRPGSTVDYLVLGDSQGYGQCLDYEASLSGRFAALAAEHGQHVANCSVGGHYLRNQLEIARWLHEEKNIEIKTVVILLSPYLITTSGGYNRVKVSSNGKLYRQEPTRKHVTKEWIRTHMVIYHRVRNMVGNVMGVEPDNSMLLGFFDTGELSKTRSDPLLQALKRDPDIGLIHRRIAQNRLCATGCGIGFRWCRGTGEPK